MTRLPLKFLILGLFMLAHVSAHASGRTVGNGGDVVVCRNPDQSIRSIELLDYYEGRTFRSLSPVLGPKDISVEAKAELLLSRLASHSPLRAELFRKWLAEMPSETTFLSGVEMVDIPDSGPAAYPKGCKIEQIAIQRLPGEMLPGDRRYTINEDLWNTLDNDSKAGLLLHELIFREAIQGEQENSVTTRYLNALLASDSLKALSTKQFILLLQDLDFRITDFNGIWIKLWEFYPSLRKSGISFHENENVADAPTSSSRQSIVLGQPAFVQDYYAEFYPDGKLKSAIVLQEKGRDFSIPTPYGPIPVCPYQGTIRLELHPSSLPLKSIQARPGTHLVSDGYDLTLQTDHCHGLLFTASGQLLNPYVDWIELDPARSRVRHLGRWYSVSGVNFHESGAVKYAMFTSPQEFQVSGRSLQLLGFETFPSGTWRQVHLAPGQSLPLPVSAQEILVQGRIVFHENGRISSGVLAKDAKLIATDGRKTRKKIGDHVYFTPEGRLAYH